MDWASKQEEVIVWRDAIAAGKQHAGKVSPPLQQLGDVQHFDWLPFAVQPAADVHQAAGVGAKRRSRRRSPGCTRILSSTMLPEICG